MRAFWWKTAARSQALLCSAFTPANRVVSVVSRAKSTFSSEPPFDATFWIKRAQEFADDQSKVARLALELLHNAETQAMAKKDEAIAKKDEAIAKRDEAIAKKDVERVEAIAKKDVERVEAIAKKVVELVEARKDAEKYKDLLAKEQRDNAKYEENDLRHKAAAVATFANRNVIEIGLKCYGNATNSTDRHQHFLSHVIEDANGQLQQGPRQTLSDLRKLSPSMPKDVDVQRELKQFIHELSKPLHNLQTTSITHLDGVLIGGDEPLCSALALYVAEFQKLNLITLRVTLINHNYDKICRLDAGQVLPP